MNGMTARTQPSAQDSGPPDPLVGLLASVSIGDEGAFERLYDATHRRVFALALQILRDRPAAEEATLDVFTQVWRQADRYEPAKGSPLGWLLVLARTRAIDHLRSRGRRTDREDPIDDAFDLSDDAPSPERQSADEQNAARVRSALARLPREQREALLAAYFDGLSHTEVALASGVPLGTIKTRIRTGLITLRRLLTEDGESLT